MTPQATPFRWRDVLAVVFVLLVMIVLSLDFLAGRQQAKSMRGKIAVLDKLTQEYGDTLPESRSAAALLMEEQRRGWVVAEDAQDWYVGVLFDVFSRAQIPLDFSFRGLAASSVSSKPLALCKKGAYIGPLFVAVGMEVRAQASISQLAGLFESLENTIPSSLLLWLVAEPVGRDDLMNLTAVVLIPGLSHREKCDDFQKLIEFQE